MTTKGRLLVATPNLQDPNFSRTVVFILEHGDDGAIGVVLNRPSETGLGEALPDWQSLAAPPAVVFVGGPVAPAAAIGLARSEAPEPLDGWAPLGDHLGTVDLSRSPDDLGIGVEELRVFAGYAGWTAGQLDAELAADGWFVVDSLPHDPFAHEPGGLWSVVLRRQPGRLAMFAHAPPQPSVN